MIEMNYKIHSKYKYIILISLILTCFAGCKFVIHNYSEEEISEMIVSDLNDRYGEEFTIDSLIKGTHLYDAKCHPINDPSLWFLCMYGEDGSYGYDMYVGSILAKEETRDFKSSLGSGFKDALVKCNSVLVVSNDSNLSMCDLVKKGELSAENAYKIDAIRKLSFVIFLDRSLIIEDYGSEYDHIEEAVNAIVDKYKNEYELDIYVDVEIFYINKKYLSTIEEYLNTGVGEIDEIVDGAKTIRLEMGTPTDNITLDLWLTREEYIYRREEV